MRRIRKKTLSKIHGLPISRFEINLDIGKRTFKYATPYAALRFIKENNILMDGQVNLKESFLKLQQEYKKWKSKKLRNYSQAWKTRIKRKREELEFIAYDFLKSINADRRINESDFEHYFELMGNAYFDPNDSRWNSLWVWIVKNAFHGNEKEALDQINKWGEVRYGTSGFWVRDETKN